MPLATRIMGQLTKIAKRIYLTYLTEPDMTFRCPLGDENLPLGSSLKDCEDKASVVRLKVDARKERVSNKVSKSDDQRANEKV